MAERSAADASDTDTTAVDRETCLAWLRQARFGEAVTCVYCGSDDLWKRGTTSKDARRYECQACGRVFNDLTDTVFDNRTVPIRELFYIIRELETHSSAALARQLGRSYDTVRAFVAAVEDADLVFDPAALREQFAAVTLVPDAAPATDADDEMTMVYVEAATRDRLRAWKRERDLTYDAAVTRLLEAAEGTPGEGAATDGDGGVDERAPVSVTKATRDRLKLWKVRQGLTYDTAIRELLDAVSADG